jgi:hypothetical protein
VAKDPYTVGLQLTPRLNVAAVDRIVIISIIACIVVMISSVRPDR